MKKFLLYLLRWQLSTPILALCLLFLQFSTIVNTIIANLIGGCIFFWIDRLIFKETLPTDSEKELCNYLRQRYDYEFDNEHYHLFDRSGKQ